MKTYKLNNKVVIKPEVITIDGVEITNPTDEDLIKAGYVINTLDNIRVDNKRKQYYKKYSDNLFISYLIHKELGETEEANIIKEQWLATRKSIKEKFPFDTNQKSTKDIRSERKKRKDEFIERKLKFEQSKIK